MSIQVTVHWEKNQVACSLDISQPLSTIIKSLCLEHFDIQEAAALYALRLLETEELITEEV